MLRVRFVLLKLSISLNSERNIVSAGRNATMWSPRGTPQLSQFETVKDFCE